MTTSGNKVLRQALDLPERERAEIAASLLESLDDPVGDRATVERAWAIEIERRCAALDAGTTGTTDWEDVRRQIEAEIRRR